MWTEELEREIEVRRLRRRLRFLQQRENTIWALYCLIAMAEEILKVLLKSR